MQIDRRFADYGLTGGLFLVCQLSLLWALGYWPTVLEQLEALKLPTGNSLLPPIITGFAGALAVIAVFVTGLILDLLASFFRTLEMKVFATHLDYNRDWLSGLIEAHKVYCGRDFETFQQAQQELLSLVRHGNFLTMLQFWKRDSRVRYTKQAKLFWDWNSPQYQRLWSFLISYIAIQSGSSAQLSLMADEYSLWRTARAIGLALLIFAFEVFFFAVEIYASSTKSNIASIAIFFLAWLFYLAGTRFSTFITHGTYTRLCFTLFSLVYVTYAKQIEASKDATVAKDHASAASAAAQ